MAVKLTDDQVKAICEAEINNASGYSDGELAEERANAMARYLGEHYGDEVEGRSQYVSREVLETLENLMPSLMRVFAEAENLVEFDPVGPGDEEQAKQETDRVNHEFWKKNRGFYNIYTFVKDALLSKNGVLKATWQQGKVEREEYERLSLLELRQLLQDQLIDREMMEATDYGDGTFDVVFRATPRGKVNIEPCPPEEAGANRDARSPYLQDARFTYQRSRKTISDLVEEGFDADVLRTIPSSDDTETEERLARRHLSDEQDTLTYATHLSTRTVWVTECHIHLDRDGDEIAELLKVTLAGGAGVDNSGSVLLDIEEVDAIPLFGAPANILTHKYNGLSIADLVVDIQHITSTLIRQMLDNVYLSNNSRTHVNENVNLEDMLTRRPGGIVRHEGKGISPSANVMLEPPTALPADAYNLLEFFQKAITSRTGAGDEIAGLDMSALARMNTGVAAMALDRARMKTEMIANILAEVGLRPLFQHIHSLLQKHQDKMEVVQLRGKWVQVNPSEWRERQNVTIKVGVGVASRERKIMALDAIWERQQAVVQGGGLGQILLPEHLYNLQADLVEAWGFDSERYWGHPSTMPPPPPPPPDPQLLVAQVHREVEMRKADVQSQGHQVDLFEARSKHQVAMLEMDAKRRENALEMQITAIKADREQLGREKDMAHGNAKAAFDLEIKQRDQELKEAVAQRDAELKANAQRIDVYKALLTHTAAMSDEQKQSFGLEVGEQTKDDTIGQMREHLKSLQAQNAMLAIQVQDAFDSQNAPKRVERDASGRPVRIGNRPITYDANGLIEGIG